MLAFDARAARVVWTVLLIFLAVGCVYLIRKTLLIFVLAILLSALMGPIANLVDRFHNRRIPRTLSIAVLYLALLGALGTGVVLVGSRVVEEAGSLAVTIPKYAQDPQLLNQLPLPWWLEEHRPKIADFVREQFRSHAQELMGAVTEAGKELLSALTNIVFLILIPILSFFFLKDAEEMSRAVASQFADGSSRNFVEEVMASVHKALVEFMRAMMQLCLATFLIFLAALALMGVPYTLLLSALAGIFELDVDHIPALAAFLEYCAARRDHLEVPLRVHVHWLPVASRTYQSGGRSSLGSAIWGRRAAPVSPSDRPLGSGPDTLQHR